MQCQRALTCLFCVLGCFLKNVLTTQLSCGLVLWWWYGESPLLREEKRRLNEICNIHWHLLDLRMVELLDVLHSAYVVVGHEIDRDTFSTKSSRAADAVQVVFHALWQ